MIRVLAVASEIFPLVKTGGLGDVVGALPPALAATGTQAITMVPGYKAVLGRLEGAEPVHRFPDLFGGPATVIRGTAAGLDLLALDAPHLFGREGNPYLAPDGREWPDNSLRFAGLGAAAAAIGAGIVPGLQFDIVHAHDWQAAMAAVYLHFHQGPRPATIVTIHNLAFQGQYPADVFARLGLPATAFSMHGLEFHGDVNFLKGGLAYADWLTTVSPTYAREITGIENGMGLDGLLRHRADRLTGILNGIDDRIWNPATDPLIAAPFNTQRLARRAANKAALQDRMGLDPEGDRLLIGVVSRLTSQKGLDMLLDRISAVLSHDGQLALLGAGEPALERAFTTAAERHKGRIGCILGYDEALAHLMQAGSDALLVPSRFEPCGLTQLYALRYGAVPVVSRVGGLADSVIDANQAALNAGVATGVQFWPATPDALEDALQRVISLWHDRRTWQRIQRNGMAADVSWTGSAARYLALYRQLLAERS
ncbi:MAG TPA: glycogen synthase GlgA [Rhodopila sp.]|nr:glycogen synthase GlgA [Rhodopila sp.]